MIRTRTDNETHVYTAEGCRADTPAATSAAAADLRVQFADSPKRCGADESRTRRAGPTSGPLERAILKTREFTSRTKGTRVFLGPISLVPDGSCLSITTPSLE